MTKRTTMLSLLVGVMVMTFSACASVPMAPTDMDMKAKAMTPPPKKALIYLYRNESMGSQAKMAVNFNGRYAGQTLSHTYLMWVVDPGKYELTSVAEDTSILPVDAKAGQTYYVWQEVKMGMWGPKSMLHLVERETGLKGVEECNLIQQSP